MPPMQEPHLPWSSCAPLAPSAGTAPGGIGARTPLGEQREAEHQISPDVSSHLKEASHRSCSQVNMWPSAPAVDWASRCPSRLGLKSLSWLGGAASLWVEWLPYKAQPKQSNCPAAHADPCWPSQGQLQALCASVSAVNREGLDQGGGRWTGDKGQS